MAFNFFDTSGLDDGELRLLLTRVSEPDYDAGWLPAYYFSIMANGFEVGQCDLRIGHNENVYYGGNIGYKVYEEYRGHRYAAKACRMLFNLARRHGMDYLYITCNPDNNASRRTCEILDGKLEGIIELPPYNSMRVEDGESEKGIYRFELKNWCDLF